MVTRTFLSKTNTIFSDNDCNFGLHPITMLHYGKYTSRILLYFDIEKIKEKYSDSNNTIHKLLMTNCGSVNALNPEGKHRASSFDVILFKLPKSWDRGNGFDDKDEFWIMGKSKISSDGSNWYQAQNGNLWEENGVYSNDTLALEYDKYSRGEKSIIVGRQHFDSGNENLSIDISDYINELIAGESKNNGLGLAFSPYLESSETNLLNYVGFFGNKTNTFYQPLIESRNSDIIRDDRYQFFLNKTNHLYLKSKIGGAMKDLDKTPICTIDGKEYPVSKVSKGIYCAEIKLSSEEYSKDTILYDEWSNLYYNGDKLDNSEMEFVTLSQTNYFELDNSPLISNKVSVTLIGIANNEKINQGNCRLIKVIFNNLYEKKSYEILSNAYYRVYVKDGNRELTIIDWDTIETDMKHNVFTINTGELLPNQYHIDIKIDNGNEIEVFKDELTFKIVNDITNLKR